MVESLSSVHKSPALNLQYHIKPGMVVSIYNPSQHLGDADRRIKKRHGKFQASLGYMRPWLREKKKRLFIFFSQESGNEALWL